MAQHDFNIANATFPAVRTDINNALSAINSTQSGTSTPSGAVAGTIWLDTTSATTPTLKYYDGTDNISLATIDHVGNTVNWLDSTVSITGLSTTATATVLTLSDSANTTTVNLIIDNQKEIRFRETTANGTNYIALKAPASLSADLTFTLPIAPTVNNQALISSTAGVMSFTPYTFPSSDGTNGQSLLTNGSGVLSFATVGLSLQSVKTANFVAVKGEAYPVNTTSASITVTLPASPSAGDQIQIFDYAGTADTNAIIINPNGNKIEGSLANVQLTNEREGAIFTFVDSTQGYLASSGVNEGSDVLSIAPYSIDFLVIAGGAGGGSGASVSTDLGGGGGAGGYRTSTQTAPTLGTVITITVGNGGAAGSGGGSGGTGSNSSISGSGLTTITSNGGGGGGGLSVRQGNNGGSGGGTAHGSTGGLFGFGNTPSTSPSQGNDGGTGTPGFSGGGGGAGSVGQTSSPTASGNGGSGTASSITGSSVTRAGGGGGASTGTATGGGGAGSSGTGTNGTANTGGGGGGGNGTGGSGGKGVVILSMPDGNYTGTTTGSPTVATGVSGKTVLTFNGDGTYTA